MASDAGPLSAGPVMVTAGVGAPEAASWLGVNSTRLGATPEFTTQRSPDRSKARELGCTMLGVASAERTTAGFGLPPAASSAWVNSMTVLFPLFATQTSPPWSMAA